MKYKAAVAALAATLAGSFYFAGRLDAQTHHSRVIDRSGLVVPMKVVRAMDSGWTCYIHIDADKYNTEWLCK